jgi:S1-C subfamily serine protease
MGLVTTWSEDANSINAAACGYAGSGVLLSGGYVLTASHVVTADYSEEVPAECNWSNVLVMFIKSVESAPDYWYKATIVADDPIRDVALLQITEAIDTAPPISSLPALTVYNEIGAPTLGMQLLFMGYPGIGGETLSLSVGMVSGYDRLVSGVRTIKTDAVLAGGSSGGPGIDALGRVVGIVMQAGSPSASDIIDCRPVYDTNGDGQVDDSDACMQVGGQFVTILDSREFVEFLTEEGHADLINGGRP